jgi:hypothetical protein
VDGVAVHRHRRHPWHRPRRHRSDLDPRHDPTPRLARLATAMEPVCVFPGCRRTAATATARGCDLDHRIPYHPTDPAGERGGGRTCSCNLQPLCRTHHQQKTAGALKVSALTPADDPAVAPGTLEWTLPSGLTCRSHPYVAASAPMQPEGPGGPGAHPNVLIALDIARALENAGTGRGTGTDTDTDTDVPDTDWADRAWQRSREQAAAARGDQRAAARRARRDAEQARREAEQARHHADNPPF